ncbi:MAG TPA: DoxX family protein [Chitinophagaceae bacterium]|nr:DoxX family protein [Chitinophagaceae bacterium]
MDLLHRLQFWGDRHHPKWMDIIRIALGIFLVYKAIDFLNNMSDLITLMSKSTSFGSFTYILAGHYAVFAHLLGGILLIFGVLTRFACIIQIPVMLGAIFFVSTNQDMLRPYAELFLSIIVLLLLIYFLIAGNGPLSVNMDEPEKVKRVVK